MHEFFVCRVSIFFIFFNSIFFNFVSVSSYHSLGRDPQVERLFVDFFTPELYPRSSLYLYNNFFNFSRECTIILSDHVSALPSCTLPTFCGHPVTFLAYKISFYQGIFVCHGNFYPYFNDRPPKTYQIIPIPSIKSTSWCNFNKKGLISDLLFMLKSNDEWFVMPQSCILYYEYYGFLYSHITMMRPHPIAVEYKDHKVTVYYMTFGTDCYIWLNNLDFAKRRTLQYVSHNEPHFCYAHNKPIQPFLYVKGFHVNFPKNKIFYEEKHVESIPSLCSDGSAYSYCANSDSDHYFFNVTSYELFLVQKEIGVIEGTVSYVFFKISQIALYLFSLLIPVLKILLKSIINYIYYYIPYAKELFLEYISSSYMFLVFLYLYIYYKLNNFLFSTFLVVVFLMVFWNCLSIF